MYDLDLSGLNLGPEKEMEVRDGLTAFLRQFEVDMAFPEGADVGEASLELELIVEGVPVRVSIPFSFNSEEPYEETKRLQGIPARNITATPGKDGRPQGGIPPEAAPA